MLKKLICLIMSVFSCYGMTSKDSDEAWEKWGKEDPNKAMSLLEQWELFSKEPVKPELSDSVCGSVEAEPHFTPNENIARLNGACMVHCYPEKYKQHYINMMVDIMVCFIQDLNDQNLVDLELMMQELLALRNEKNAEGIDKVLEKIKNLKEE
jgi:hypothetical protein